MPIMLLYFSCIDVKENNHVVLLGSNVSFTCVANITENSLTGTKALGILINNRHLLTSTDAHKIIEIYGNRSFTWTFLKRNSQEIGKVYILASEENNGTTVRCIIEEIITPAEKIIAVEGVLIIMAAGSYCVYLLL